ncbi:MAG: hypothetical protein Q8J78_09545, partial [Moraxellaceae bacterium]|nr:hypothetical protein [Moraxellaceae bacterium]
SCSTQHFGSSGELQQVTGFERSGGACQIISEQSLPLWLFRSQAQCVSVGFRRSMLDDRIFSGPSTLRYCIDYLLFGKAAILGGWIYNPKPTAQYREHGNSGSAQGLSRRQGGVEIAHVRRLLCQFAIQNRFFSETLLETEVKQWPVHKRAALIMALAATDAPPQLQVIAQALLDQNSAVFYDHLSSKQTRLARWLGRWSIKYADPLARWRSGWHPADDNALFQLHGNSGRLCDSGAGSLIAPNIGARHST